MTCYTPLEAWSHRTLKTPNGKRLISFAPTAAFRADAERINLPCGQCTGCRLARSAMWAIRCVHEASLYPDNCFITLTFANEHLPKNHSLDVSYFQKFMKRLRKKYGAGCRYFHCGEYGSQFGRPHYHACLFNFDFPDKYVWRRTKQGHLVWRSPSLEKLWPFGQSEIGAVTFESAAYVARYIMDKVTISHASDDAAIQKFIDHYEWIDTSTGEVIMRSPEYVTMSRRPGIGQDWFHKYSPDVYPHDFVVLNGRKMRPPKYYDAQFELIDPAEFECIKYQRYLDGVKHIENNTPERLAVRHQVKIAQLSSLKRTLD